jgi:Concanavalin A-like lectin/glucanases superfamily
MSASLIILIPFVLLGLVTTLCFVGCALPFYVADFTHYDSVVLGTPNLVAFWPLDDLGGTTAADAGVYHFDGKYDGTYAPGQPGIVKGSQISGGGFGFLSPCVLFAGGKVSVPFALPLNAPGPFTIEAWVKPNWTATDPQVQRAVVVSAFLDESANPTASAGYALVASGNFWSAQIGIGTQFMGATSSQPIILDGSTYYLAMTFDGTTLNLYVNPVLPLVAAATATIPANAAFIPVGKTQTPLFIGMGRPDIGGMFPFSGWIQDVVFYNRALDHKTIYDHHMIGSGLAI